MIKLLHPDPEISGGAINEALIAATEESARLTEEVKRLKEENERLQVDYANKLAKAKIDYETKELDLMKQIRDLRKSLELRNSNERQKEQKRTISPNQLWDEALNIGKK